MPRRRSTKLPVARAVKAPPTASTGWTTPISPSAVAVVEGGSLGRRFVDIIDAQAPVGRSRIDLFYMHSLAARRGAATGILTFLVILLCYFFGLGSL